MAKLKRGDVCVIFRMKKNSDYYDDRKLLYGRKVEIRTEEPDKLPGGYVECVVRLLENIPGFHLEAGHQILARAILKKI
ncbi:MAG: hypothetical protein Q8N59_01250 [bacterium]|nr:hypothetical protein [bacterium]